MSEDRFAGLESQLDVERRKVDVSTVSFSVRELVRMYEDGELSIAPTYQRKYRWPTKVASTFVESIFLGLPIPPIFVATNDNFDWEVVDGVQRISTLILFLSDDKDGRDKIGRTDPLILTGLEKLSQLNGVAYRGLPTAIQRYFARQPLQVISLTDKSDRGVRFDLFERLNTGAISLTPQEVRSAVYKGNFINFVEDLASNAQLSALLKLQEANRNDGTAAEQVLKFFAYKNDASSFSGAVTHFLNNYAGEAERDFPYTSERKIFEQTMTFLLQATEGRPFKRRSTKVTPLVQFEACAVGVANIISDGRVPVVPGFDWIEDAELVRTSTGGSNTRTKLRGRIDRAVEIFGG